ncbi:hypothetical protein PENSPDRAFT_549752, partial [Peniophora sp. CONT]
FAERVLRVSQAPMIVILGLLAYMDRARSGLLILSEVRACERLILGLLMVASKYIYKSNTDHLTWSITSGIFDLYNTARIEREAFEVLQWDLTVSEREL